MDRRAGGNPLRILYVSAEIFPLAKVGGLADVAASLPKALAHLGHDVRVVIPFYSKCNPGESCHHLMTVLAELYGRTIEAEVFHTLHSSGVPLYLIGNDVYFGRDTIYGYPDDDERFLFFNKAVIALLSSGGWLPDIVHCNDWHSALIPYYLRSDPNHQSFSRVSTVFTIHNLAYQGPCSERTQQLIGPPHGVDTNMMAMGIRYADALNTVSPTYLSEILTPEFGENMDALLRWRLPDLRGILNGIDYEEFNPRQDPFIPTLYDGRSILKKAKNKVILQHWSELPLKQTTPLAGVVSRFTEQKGIDIICQALEALLEMGVQLVIMGRGDAGYEEMVRAQAARYPAAVKYYERDDESLARLIYAGADMLLVPSNFEPCGLAPLIAIHYGTVPVVRATGGLADTIVDYSGDPLRGLGFSFAGKAPEELVDAVERALCVYYRRDEWRSLVRRLMLTDFSWERSSQQYVQLYHHALSKRYSMLTSAAPTTDSHR